MKRATLIAAILLTALYGFSNTAHALTMAQFSQICTSIKGECSEHPLLNAYVGGALDLIAMLDEETDYLAKIYCDKPPNLFDVPRIIRYMQAHSADFAERNAMLVVIRYFEEHGGC